MEKIKITLATVGHMPAELDKRKIISWKSSILDITSDIESYVLKNNSDGDCWEYSDKNIQDALPNEFAGDFLIAIVNVPLELNWYSRRLSDNRIVFSFHEIKDILRASDIPLENVIYRILYAYTFAYKKSGSTIPLYDDTSSFTHDETRGCLFDMNGIKTDIIHSCDNPIICDECVEKLRGSKVSNESIAKAKKELKKIKKPLFYIISGLVKTHPIYALAISSVFAILLGVIGSYISTVLYEYINIPK